MTTRTTTDWDLRVTILPTVDNAGEPCEHCAMEDAVVQANAYVVTGNDRDHHLDTVLVECCLSCLIPAIDSVPWAESTEPVTVEVCRDATRRPF